MKNIISYVKCVFELSEIEELIKNENDISKLKKYNKRLNEIADECCYGDKNSKSLVYSEILKIKRTIENKIEQIREL